jgi:flagellar biosynthesis GTPase FlhF
MTARDLAVLVLCYGLGYALMRHCHIGIALGGLVGVGFFAQQRHGGESVVLIAYSLGIVACWVLKRRWLAVGGYRWRLPRLFPDFRAWRFRASRKNTEGPNRETEGTRDADKDFRGGQASAAYRRRAEEARAHRAEEARRRRQQEDARKGHRGTSGSDQRQEHTQERNEEAPKQKQRWKQREQGQEQSNERKQEDAQHGQQNEQGKTLTEPPTDTRTPEEVLGVQPGCSLEELKYAYRQQCQRLHPDRWQDRPPHIRSMLEEEQKRVNVAFETLEKRLK